MKFVSFLILMPLMIYAWVVTNPLQARAFIAEIKRRWRRYLIQRKGKAAASDVVNEFRTQANNQGFQKEQIEEIVTEKWPELVERLGTKETNASLGEPTSLERYF